MRPLIVLAALLTIGCDIGVVSDAKDAVRRQLLDPDAAQFRDVRACTGDRKVVRGEVNGKNTFGAYTGFKPFFYSEYSVAFAESPGFTTMMDRCYSDLGNEKEVEEAQPTGDQLIKDAKEVAAAAQAASATAPMVDEAANDQDLREEGFDPDGGAQPDECWQDYCPCDTSDPDYGYADIPLCRNLRAGLPVDDQLMADGAASRDARRAIREHEERYGAFE